MQTVIKSFYTDPETGQKRYTAMLNAMPIMATTDDEQRAWEYARATYHSLRSPKRLQFWNGDTSTLTTEDEA